MEKQWLAIYTQPRWEKKVHKLLEDKGLESYCPLNMVYRQWSDRVKKVEEPLFKSYVFVHVTEAERTEVRMTHGVINYVYWLGKPAVIKESDIENIRRFLNEYTDVEVQPIQDIQPGSRLVITSGILLGQEATTINAGKKFVEVLIETLGCKLVAKIEREKLKIKG
ncbi:MAG: UpxY family transcription antiterminator [Bacteroidota bacterium]